MMRMAVRERDRMREKERMRRLFFIIVVCAIFCFMAAFYVRAAVLNYGMEGDEVFSYISASSLGGYKGICYLEDQTWYEGSYFRDALTAEGEERFNYKMVVENQAMDTHPPFYYLLLNVVVSFFPGQFSRWFGIGLNIFLMFLVWAGLYLLLQHFLHRRYMAAFFSTLFCCSYLSVSLVLFIRMYVLLTAVALFQTWYHLKLYDEMKKEAVFSGRSHLKSYMFLALLTFLGAWTHYYFIIYQCLLSFFFCAALLWQRKYSDVLRYSGTLAVSALIYVFLYPASLNHLFFKYRGRDAVHKLLKGSSLTGEVWEMFRLYNRELYHGMFLILAGILSLITLALIIKGKMRWKAIGKGVFLMAPLGIYFFVISKASPFVTLRYIAPVSPVLFAATVVWIFHLLKRLNICQRAGRVLTIGICLVFIPITVYWWERPIKYDFFAEKRDVIFELADETDFCVYVTGDEYNWKMWEDYIYYPLFEGLYFIDGTEKKPISDSRLISQDSLTIFIDSALDEDEILDYIGEYLPYQSCELVYTAQYHSIYLVQ